MGPKSPALQADLLLSFVYPALGPDGSALFDTVPRAAQPGYLVTKVVAVDYFILSAHVTISVHFG